ELRVLAAEAADRVLGLEELEHLAVGGPPGLATAERRKAEPLEEDLPELLRGVDHELAARELPDLVAELVGALADAVGDLAQAVRVDPDAGPLHASEDGHQRQLDLLGEGGGAPPRRPRPRAPAPARGARRGRG